MNPYITSSVDDLVSTNHNEIVVIAAAGQEAPTAQTIEAMEDLGQCVQTR